MSEPNEPEAIRPIDPGARIGHVHLKVSDLARPLDFYCGILGFELMTTYGTEAAFISAGGYHHTSASTPGSRSVAHHRRPERPACSTSPCSTRTGQDSGTPCSGSSEPDGL